MLRADLHGLTRTLPLSRQHYAPPPSCARPAISRCSYSGSAQFADGVGQAGFAADSSREQTGNSPVDGVKSAMTQPVKSRWRAWVSETNRLRSQLQAYGAAGVLAYGLLNTVYYSGAFLFIWLYVSPVPRGLGWPMVAQKFATVMGLTWAASQVTKVPRAALALLFAPVADGALLFLQARLRLRSRRNAFLFVLACCFLLSAMLFGFVIAVWV